MLLALFSWLGGFVIRLLPECFGIWKAAQENKHEFALLDRTAKADLAQAKLKAETTLSKSEMMLLAQDTANLRDALLKERELLPTQKRVGIRWLDGINSSIRTIVTLWMLTLYTLIKWESMQMLLAFSYANAPRFIPFDVVAVLWTDYDTSLLSAIIGYHFGAQAIKHARR